MPDVSKTVASRFAPYCSGAALHDDVMDVGDGGEDQRCSCFHEAKAEEKDNGDGEQGRRSAEMQGWQGCGGMEAE